MSKAELGLQFRLSWRTLANWMELCELNRHLGVGAAACTRCPTAAHKLDSDSGIVVVLFRVFALGLQPQ